jgi:hypothetical protein
VVLERVVDVADHGDRIDQQVSDHVVPGLNALDTTAQILAWALVFGFAQELFTHFVDQQARPFSTAFAPPMQAGPPRRRWRADYSSLLNCRSHGPSGLPTAD